LQTLYQAHQHTTLVVVAVHTLAAQWVQGAMAAVVTQAILGQRQVQLTQVVAVVVVAVLLDKKVVLALLLSVMLIPTTQLHQPQAHPQSQ
jgi:hypothetical protein